MNIGEFFKDIGSIIARILVKKDLDAADDRENALQEQLAKKHQQLFEVFESRNTVFAKMELLERRYLTQTRKMERKHAGLVKALKEDLAASRREIVQLQNQLAAIVIANEGLKRHIAHQDVAQRNLPLWTEQFPKLPPPAA